jgi:hypothetical protein
MVLVIFAKVIWATGPEGLPYVLIAGPKGRGNHPSSVIPDLIGNPVFSFLLKCHYLKILTGKMPSYK